MQSETENRCKRYNAWWCVATRDVLVLKNGFLRANPAASSIARHTIMTMRKRHIDVRVILYELPIAGIFLPRSS